MGRFSTVRRVGMRATFKILSKREENFKSGKEPEPWQAGLGVENSHVSEALYRPGEAVSDGPKNSYAL